MSEAKEQADIRQDLGSLTFLRMFRNNVGALVDKVGRLVRYGLGIGTSDLIGIVSITITPEMVGQKIGVFCAIEVKDKNGRATPEQKSFIKMVRNLGGYAGIARCIADARRIVAGQSTGETDEPRDR